jgi:methionine sulfoxide reductase heme-binding subunit
MGGKYVPLILSVVLSAKAVMIALLLGGDWTEQLQLAARYTARAAFPIFLIAYAASSMLRLWPNEATRAIMRHRRQWGLGFAFAHTVHLVALGWYNIEIAHTPAAQTLLGGGLAYGLMYVMALTSNNASMKAMGKWWKRLHTAGIHWLWFIFTFSYFGRIFDPERQLQGALLFSLCLAALGLRVWVWARRRFRAQQPA